MVNYNSPAEYYCSTQSSRLLLWGSMTASLKLSVWGCRLLTPPVAAMNLVSLITICFDLSDVISEVGVRSSSYLARLAR